MFNARVSPSSDGAVLTTPGVAVMTGSALSYKRRTATDGVLFGIDQNQSLVILNQFDQRNPSYNANVLGQTGSGKTFGILCMMMRHLLLGCRLIIVDPQGNIDLSFLGDEYYHVSRLGTAIVRRSTGTTGGERKRVTLASKDAPRSGTTSTVSVSGSTEIS